jgi:uncharacterized membrane protein (Fun14 family)
MVPEGIALAIGLVPAQLDGIPFQQIGIEAGGGAIIGGVIGFAAKKIAKLIAVLIGLELALFKFLETRGVLDVNWNKITNASSNVTDAAQEGDRQVRATSTPCCRRYRSVRASPAGSSSASERGNRRAFFGSPRCTDHRVEMSSSFSTILVSAVPLETSLTRS